MSDKILNCPDCKTVFVCRKNGQCPGCGIRIVKDGEIWFPDDEGYYYRNMKFIPLNKLKDGSKKIWNT